jgi:integrase
VGKHIDGEGLVLVLTERNRGKWVLRLTRDGKRREMGLGAYPAVSLAEARTAAAAARELARKGGDPIEARREVEPEPEPIPTFSQAVASYIADHAPGWRNAKHGAQWSATLATYAEPVLGSKPVDAIDTEAVLAVLSPIWTTKTETAKRVQGRMENVLDFAAARKWRDPVNPARWRGHLDKLLPRPTKVKRPAHHPAMPFNEVPAFVAELDLKPGISAVALRFLILTACRTGEVLGAQWGEIDLEAAIWTVPAERMKAGRPHRVPLTGPALAALAALPRVDGCPFAFPGAREGRPVSNMALLQLMRGMGYGVGGDRGAYVPHGFRSAFRDWAGEVSSFPRDVCEMALAHVIGNKVEAAYRRGDLFAKRRAMMDAWAAWCTTAPATVASMRRRA